MSNAALITITSINLVVSSVTLGGLIYAGIKGMQAKKELEKKIDVELHHAKAQTNSAIRKLRNALDSVQL